MDYKAINEAASMEAVLAAYGIRADAHKKVALCPFHADKDPSLHVYAHGFYCFACGAGGDVVKFVQRMDGVSAADAARKVAEISGYGLPEHTRRPSALRARRRAEQLKQAELAEARMLDARFELDLCMGAAAARIEAAEPLSLEWALAWRVYNDLLRQDDELREKEILQNGNKN